MQLQQHPGNRVAVVAQRQSTRLRYKNLRGCWLDSCRMLGIFSLPFLLRNKFVEYSIPGPSIRSISKDYWKNIFPALLLEWDIMDGRLWWHKGKALTFGAVVLGLMPGVNKKIVSSYLCLALSWFISRAWFMKLDELYSLWYEMER